MSLIDKEKLIAEYDRVHIGPSGGARKLMEEAPVVDRWIPMSEKKPRIKQKCLVCDKNGIILIDTYIGKPAPYIWNWYMYDYAAWMPLPAPYKEEQKHE